MTKQIHLTIKWDVEFFHQPPIKLINIKIIFNLCTNVSIFIFKKKTSILNDTFLPWVSINFHFKKAINGLC